MEFSSGVVDFKFGTSSSVIKSISLLRSFIGVKSPSKSTTDLTAGEFNSLFGLTRVVTSGIHSELILLGNVKDTRGIGASLFR